MAVSVPSSRLLKTCSGLAVASIVSGLTIQRELSIAVVRDKLYNQQDVEAMKTAANFAGAISAGLALYFIGRRWTAIMTSVMFVLPLLAIATDYGPRTELTGIVTFHVARTQLYAAYSVYAAEATVPKLRGSVMSTYYVGYKAGELAGALFEPNSKKLVMIALLMVLGGLVLVFRMPDTPHWLTLKRRHQEAAQLFAWSRGGENVDADELEATRGKLEAPSGGVRALLSAKFYTPLMLFAGLQLAYADSCDLLRPTLEDAVRHYKFDGPDSLSGPVLMGLSAASLFHYVGALLGSIAAVGLCFVAGRRLLFLASTLSGVAIFFVHVFAFVPVKIAIYISLCCDFFNFVGAEQIILIMPTEEPTVIEPIFEGYQLIGDSQFLRFSESLLNLKRKEKDGFSLLGLCVSGQRIRHLLDRVRTSFGDVSEKVILMIGTNDLLGGTSFVKMRDDLKELLQLLSQSAKKIILLTLPPVLKLEKSSYHWDRLEKYNKLIQEFHDGELLFVGNAYVEFVYPKESQKIFSSTCNSNLANCRKSLPSNPFGLPENDSKCAENDDEVSLFPPSSKRPRRSPLWRPNNQGDSTPQKVHEQHYLSNLMESNEDCHSRAVKQRHSWPIEKTKSSLMPARSLDRAPLSISTVSTAHSSNNAPMLSSVDTITPSDCALMPSSSSATTPSSDSVRMLSANDVAVSPFGGASLFSGDAASPSGDVMSPSGNVASLSSDPSSSGDTVTLLGDASRTFDNPSALSGDAISPDATPTPGSAASPATDAASHSSGAARLGRITATPDDPTKLSCDPVPLFGPSAVLSDSADAPGGAVSLPGSALSPSCVAKSDSGGAVSSPGDPPSHAGGATTPSDEVTSLSGGAMKSSGDAMSPPCDGTPQSGGALTPFGCATPSSWGSPTTPSSGDNDPFTTRSRKKLPFKRKSYSRGNDRYHWRTDEIEIENADKIRDEYFEKYYDSDCRRPDLIHLNAEGLRVIERIIRDIIDTLDVEKSQD